MKQLVFRPDLIFACLLSFYLSNASAAIMVEFDPLQPMSVVSGGPISVDVNISGLGGEIVSAYDFDILYDNNVLDPLDVTFGNFLDDSLFLSIQVFDFTQSGIVDVAELSFLSDLELMAIQPDSFTLFTIGFDVLADAQTSLAFNWGPGNDIKGKNNAIIFPAAIPEPPLFILLGIGAALLQLNKRNERKLNPST